MENSPPLSLTSEEKSDLLKFARISIQKWIVEKEKIDFDPTSSALHSPGGAFVTLTKNHRLRGCIGRLKSKLPLWQIVRDMAISAATEDPRFPPVQEEEIHLLEIEISVLSPLEPISSIEKIEIGRHGLYLRQGHHSGVLLPQVATQFGWDAAEFVRGVCKKSGLDPRSLEDKAQLFRFEALVFGD